MIIISQLRRRAGKPWMRGCAAAAAPRRHKRRGGEPPGSWHGFIFCWGFAYLANIFKLKMLASIEKVQGT